ncbi:MAG: hypothetical protein JO332_20515 [Planctomycetaceae bacterium]|nr:hypothetical protein [Planctomycetaceae bacterium]
MPTFTYSPTDSVTIAPNGDVSVTDGGTTTTFTKQPPTKTVTKTPPDPNPPVPENPVTVKPKPNGDVSHTYSDITKTPPVTVKITFKANGDIEFVTTIGQDRTLVEINGGTGVRRTKVWKDPDPEPSTFGKTDAPKTPGGSSSSSGGKKKGKKPAGRGKPSKKRRPAKKASRKPAKRKASSAAKKKKKARRR